MKGTAAAAEPAAPEVEKLDAGAGHDTATGGKAGVVLEGTAVDVTDAAADGADAVPAAAAGDALAQGTDATGAGGDAGADAAQPQQPDAGDVGADDARAGAGGADDGAADDAAKDEADARDKTENGANGVATASNGSAGGADDRANGDAHAEAGATLAAQAAPAVVARATRTGAGLGGVVLAALLGGGIGVGGAWWLDRNMPPSNDAQSMQIAQQAERIQTLADRTEALDGQVKALDQRIARQEARADDAAAPVDLGPVEDRIAALEARLDALEADQAALRDGIAAAGGPDQGAAGALSTELQARIEALSDDLASRKAALDSLKEALGAELAQAKQAIDAARSARDEVVQSARVEIALSRIEAALESGDPFAADLQTLRGAGLEIPDALDAVAGTGVPTLLDLQDGFDEAARAALRATTAAGSEGQGGFLAFLKSQVSTRSLGPREGADPDAVLSRARAAVMAGDLAAALAEIATLPDPAKRALADWSGRAQARLDALAAVDAVRSALAAR